MTWTFLNFLVNRVTATCDGVQGMEENTLSNLFFLGGVFWKPLQFFYINGSVKNVIKFTFFSRQIQALIELTWSPKLKALKNWQSFPKQGTLFCTKCGSPVDLVRLMSIWRDSTCLRFLKTQSINNNYTSSKSIRNLFPYH